MKNSYYKKISYLNKKKIKDNENMNAKNIIY